MTTLIAPARFVLTAAHIRHPGEERTLCGKPLAVDELWTVVAPDPEVPVCRGCQHAQQWKEAHVSRRGEPLSEEDEVTLWALALVEHTTVAEQRRRAIRAYTKDARCHPNIAELVRINIGWKKQREERDASNVIPLRRPM